MFQVAVGIDGTIYVSDGYCNSRVASFTASGVFIGDYVVNSPVMDVPHSLVLDECGGFLMVADREASKVHRFKLSSREYAGEHLQT